MGQGRIEVKGKPRILIVCGEIPYPLDSGGRLSVYMQIKALSQVADITLLAVDVGESSGTSSESALNRYAKEVKILSRALPRASTSFDAIRYLASRLPRSAQVVASESNRVEVHDWLATKHFDLVLMQGPVVLPLLPHAAYDAPLVYVAHNIERVLMREQILRGATIQQRLLGLVDYKRIAQLESKAVSAADKTICLSSSDAETLRRLHPSSAIVCLPQIMPERQSRWSGGDVAPRVMVFGGSLTRFTDWDAVCWMARAILPRIRRKAFGAELHVFGEAPVSLRRRLAGTEGLVLLGRITDAERDMLLCSADLYVCPLRTGSGIKLKLLEAASMGLPIVTTPKGVEGLRFAHGSEVLVGAGVEEITELCVEALSKQSVCVELSHRVSMAFDHYYAESVASACWSSEIMGWLDC